jgi:hypothetical protein
MRESRSPLLDHPLGSASVFKPEDLMNAVRRDRRIKSQPVPALCILDFDGDLADVSDCGFMQARNLELRSSQTINKI